MVSANHKLIIHYESSGLFGGVALRELVASDKEMVRQWRNSPKVAAHMFSQHEIGIEEHHRWFKALARDSTRRYWIITYNKRPVGVINLAKIDLDLRSAEFGIYLGEDDARGKGIGTCAQFLLIEHVFSSMNLERLTCEVLADNERALKMYKSVGLRTTPNAPCYVNSDMRRFDVVHLTISRKEWPEMRELLIKRIGEKKCS